MRKPTYILLLLAIATAVAAMGAEPKITISAPKLDSIRTETTNEKSRYYYPRLLKQFMSNDTVMQNEDFRYFYYGTMYQEDYNPYRAQFDEERLSQIEPLYYKHDHTNAELRSMLSYAEDALRDNPVDLVQLKNKVYVLEQQGKENLARIWKNKLNHLLFVIASSGLGNTIDSPWIVVYPRHEFDLFNIYGMQVQAQEYLQPHYDHVTVGHGRDASDSYYFDMAPLLEQYYMKHPSDLE